MRWRVTKDGKCKPMGEESSGGEGDQGCKKFFEGRTESSCKTNTEVDIRGGVEGHRRVRFRYKLT